MGGGGGGGGGKGGAAPVDTSASDKLAAQNAEQKAKLDAQERKQQLEQQGRIAARSRGGTRMLMSGFTPATDVAAADTGTQTTLGPA